MEGEGTGGKGRGETREWGKKWRGNVRFFP